MDVGWSFEVYFSIGTFVYALQPKKHRYGTFCLFLVHNLAGILPGWCQVGTRLQINTEVAAGLAQREGGSPESLRSIHTSSRTVWWVLSGTLFPAWSYGIVSGSTMIPSFLHQACIILFRNSFLLSKCSCFNLFPVCHSPSAWYSFIHLIILSAFFIARKYTFWKLVASSVNIIIYNASLTDLTVEGLYKSI